MNNYLETEEQNISIVETEKVKAEQARLQIKVCIFNVCSLSFVMSHGNWQFFSWSMIRILNCLKYLPNLRGLKYFTEAQAPSANIQNASYQRIGSSSEIPFILSQIKLFRKFFKKCSDAQVNPESLSQEEADAYEIIKADLNLLLDKAFRQVKFTPTLNSRLADLIPAATNIEEFETDQCCVNTRLYIQKNQITPGYVYKRISGCTPPLPDSSVFCAIVWVEDPINHFLMPFAVTDEELNLVNNLLSGRVLPAELPTEVARIFYMAKILLKKEKPEIMARRADNFVQEATEALNRDSYVVLRGILNPLQIAAYREYYRNMESAGLLLADKTSGRRFFKHNEILAKFVHAQLETLLNQILPEKIKKSYCFSRVHKPGAILKKHVDRAQCEWNVSLIFDMGPGREQEVPWPIFLEIRGESKEVMLGMGDAVLYQGTKIPHWRNELPAGHETTAVFFHFVNQNFSGDLN